MNERLANLPATRAEARMGVRDHRLNGGIV
jgi:hypothetical protein